MNTKSDLYKMATKIILITFLNTNWINSSLKGTYSSTLDLFWTWKTKTLTRAKKELILKKMSPAWIMMSATVILLRTGASSEMGPKTFWSWIYISYNFTRFYTKLKLSYALKSKLFCIPVESNVFISVRNLLMTLWHCMLSRRQMDLTLKQRKCILESQM